MTRRTAILLLILACALALVAAWAGRFMMAQRNAAGTAGQDLQDCVKMAGEIEQLSRRPALATEHERLSSEITGLIEKAARLAGIAAESLSSIAPETPRRLGDTAYKEKPTQVLLRKVTLKQVVTLTHALIRADAGLHAKAIRLSVPREHENSDWWTAELVVTYLIYDPLRSEKQGVIER